LLDRLLSLETFGIKLGLENISTLCEALGHPEHSFTSLHVAGTNGKGSVTAMAHAALRAAGLRAARYTSPHLADITERFVIGDAPVDAATFDDVAGDVLDLADGLVQSGALRASPTFFEATTAIAFELFRRARTEVAVIEVGLGGRFDATNVIHPAAGAITTIGFDHQQHLGHTLAEIAFEKAGIIKNGMPIVAGRLPPEAMDVVRRVARERAASLFETGSDVAVDAAPGDGRFVVTVRTSEATYGPLTLALRGEHQVHNAAVAVRLLEVARGGGLQVPHGAIAAGLTAASWPARLERLEIRDGRQVLLDAAHNAEGAVALADHLARWHPERPTLVVGVMRDKDTAAIVEPLLPRVRHVIATAAQTPRALSAADLEERLRAIASRLPEGERPSIAREDDPLAAVDRALELGGMVVVAGSIFLVGPVREGLLARANLR
jgi:dihydrofolate synthase / folylpolyglutamate synthase